MSDKKNVYAGRIKNAGTQRVEAPFSAGSKGRKGTVRYEGKDLRTGSSGKK